MPVPPEQKELEGLPGVYDNPDYTSHDMLLWDAEIGCQICFQKEAENYNPIIYCNECGSGTHARCYGEEMIEDIDCKWTCQYCKRKDKIKDKNDLYCELCNRKDGMLKLDNYQKPVKAKKKEA